MEAIVYLLNFVFDAYLMLLVLRVWLQAVRADFYNPFSQFVVKATNPAVIPFRRLIPGLKGIDMATLLVAFLVACTKYWALSMIGGQTIDILSLLFISLLFVIKQSGTLLFVVMLVMALMSWVVQSRSPAQMVFYQLTEPFLRPIRRIMPNLGGLDLSVLVAFVLLNVINIFIGSFIPIWSYL
ncbi:YggT family protein [Thalassotalea sp. ND16A]|uniref:YggT family protein n=1 Tax=Thalassotalea sp. ND16A TaxID=1535422 RepID=UPI00051A1C1E|nr:YggT family protein [Thalassotalea sp. ND16A]KGK00656.1 hypothetical protein ND16A_3416 [Thalassotalea sp. ND16A]